MALDRYDSMRLGDIAEIHAGYQLRESVQPNPDGNIKFIQVRDVDRDSHQVDLSGVDVIKLDKDIDVEKYWVKENEALFLAKGSKPGAFMVKGFDSIKKGRFAPVPMSHFFVVRPDQQKLLPSFLVWLLNQSFMDSTVKKSMAGSGIPFIPKHAFLDYRIPLPPIELQKKIVQVYETHMHEKHLVRRREALMDKLVETALMKKIL